MMSGRAGREKTGRTVAARLRRLALGAIGAFIALSSGTSAQAEPGLWVAHGPNSTIYLFGTIHLLRPGQQWETPRVAAALAASRELWLEIPNPDDVEESRRLIGELGFDREHPLATKLPAAVLARLDAAAKEVGIANGEKALEPMRPWLASVALEDALLTHDGFDAADGVERRLLEDARAARKPVRGFETMDQQMHLLAALDPASERDMLEETLQDFDQGPQTLDALITAWENHDEAAIERLMVDEVKRPFPDLYRHILVDRNEAWAGAISAMVQQPGVRFIAVGAAHLAGPDSVQAALERRGVAVAPVAP